MQENFRFVLLLLHVQHLGTEQIRACVSCCDQSSWIAN